MSSSSSDSDESDEEEKPQNTSVKEESKFSLDGIEKLSDAESKA